MFDEKGKPDIRERTILKRYGYLAMPGVIALSAVFFTVGVLFGSWINARPDFVGVHILIAIILAIGIRYPVHIWMRWAEHTDAYTDQLVAEHNKYRDELILKNAQQQQQVEKQERKAYAFTSEDFGTKAVAMLEKMVKSCRRRKVKVSGEYLVKALLKSIR